MKDPRSSKQPKNREVLIALLGLTGAGKSTFASVASGKTLKIGHTVDPCTQEPEAIDFMVDGRRVTLIDTPGFDDDARSDVEILESIATWMSEQGYSKNQRRLDGLILLHPITHNRVGGSERKRTRLLQNILGPDAYKRIIIGTTMWSEIKDEDSVESRLHGRLAEGGVWNELKSKGTVIIRHENSKESAHNIIGEIIKMSNELGGFDPLLQLELQKDPRVANTSAGREVMNDLLVEIKLIKGQLRDHHSNRPSDSSRKGKDDVAKRRAMKEWREDRDFMLQRLDRLELQVKKLNSLTFKLKSFWSALFGTN